MAERQEQDASQYVSIFSPIIIKIIISRKISLQSTIQLGPPPLWLDRVAVVEKVVCGKGEQQVECFFSHFFRVVTFKIPNNIDNTLAKPCRMSAV